MERPAATDSAMRGGTDSSTAGAKKQGKAQTKSQQQTNRDTTRQDSTKWGYKANHHPDVQNPAGYRGMERPVNVFPPDSSKSDSGAPADATSRVNQMKRQDSVSQAGQQNPPGYRGMERPVDTDRSGQHADSTSTGTAGSGQ
jgi:hypothetical protein